MLNCRYVTLQMRSLRIKTHLSYIFNKFNYITARFFGTRVFSIALLVSIQVLYSVFEFGIGVIQAYIFCLLITLYSDEHPH